MLRNPVLVGGGTPFLPAGTEDVSLDLIETEAPANACRRTGISVRGCLGDA